MHSFLTNLFQQWWILIFLGFIFGYRLKAQLFRRNPDYLQNQGEALVSKLLLAELPNESWHLLNNITLEVDGGTTQVDHILVSRFGLFVIETKDYDGWVFGDEKSKRWTQITRSGKYPFQNPIHQNYKHLKAVQALMDFLPKEQVISLVVFIGAAKFKTVQPDGVFSINELINYLKSLNKEVLSDNRMQFCVGRLECKRLALTRETDIQHQAHIQAKNF